MKYLKLCSFKPNSTRANLLLLIGDKGGSKRQVKIETPKPSKQRNTFFRNIAYLEKKEILKIIQKNKKDLFLSLSVLGKAEYLALKLVYADSLPEDTVCMVVFDIPEKQKKIRNLLRKFLINNCFFPLQKSVWISPFDYSEVLVELFDLLNLKSQVRVFNAFEK